MKLNKNLSKILNLNDIEIKILESLNETKSIQEVAKFSKYSRTGIKYAILSLYKRGFVKRIKHGKRFLYFALTTGELSRLIEDGVDELMLRNKYRKGARIKTSFENEFVIHVGVNEILPAYKRIASMNKNERIRAIQHHRSWLELTKRITTDELVDFNNNIIRNHIILDGMLNESAYKSYQKEILSDPEKHKKNVESLKGRMADYTVFPDKYFNYDVEIWMFKTTVLIINWKEEVAIEITNQNTAFFLKDMFEFVKNAGIKIDHNKFLNEVLR